MSVTVLIVDDSKLARMSVAKSLAALRPNWGRREAAGADEALEAVRGGGIDILLLDFNMPGRDGLDLAAELRALRPDMPIAVVSANTQKEIVERASLVGASFLAKPVTEDVLKGFLDSAERGVGSKA